MNPRTTALLDSWKRALRAENKSPRTIETYSLAVRQFHAWTAEDVTPDEIRRADVRRFIEHLLEEKSAATAKQRFASLRVWFGWLVDEEEIDESPMEKLKPPKVVEQPPPVLTADELRRVLATCSGRGSDDRRDQAFLSLLIDTGARLSEVVNLTTDDVDLDLDVIVVHGKGGRLRSVPFGAQTARALDRWLRIRSGHRDAHLPALWLGLGGPLTRSGGYQLVRRRGRQAGIEGLHPHLFRHTMAHQWLTDGGQERDLLLVAGWSEPRMLARYGASAAGERAREAQRKHSLRDRLR